MAIERINITSWRMYTRDASGKVTFDTDNRYLARNMGGDMALGGFDGVPVCAGGAGWGDAGLHLGRRHVWATDWYNHNMTVKDEGMGAIFAGRSSLRYFDYGWFPVLAWYHRPMDDKPLTFHMLESDHIKIRVGNRPDPFWYQFTLRTYEWYNKPSASSAICPILVNGQDTGGRYRYHLLTSWCLISTLNENGEGHIVWRRGLHPFVLWIEIVNGYLPGVGHMTFAEHTKLCRINGTYTFVNVGNSQFPSGWYRPGDERSPDDPSWMGDIPIKEINFHAQENLMFKPNDSIWYLPLWIMIKRNHVRVSEILTV